MPGKKSILQSLAFTALLLVMPAAHAAGVNPRDGQRDVPQVIREPVTQPGQIAMWLRRMVGRYRVEGSVFMLSRTFEFRNTEGEMTEVEFGPRMVSARGVADCVAVGTGPGLQCIFNVTWLDEFETIVDPDQGPVGVFNLPGGAAYLDPSMLLVGLDPPGKGVTFLLVDKKGLPEGGSGTLAGERATLRAPCVNAPKLFQSMNPAAKFNDRLPQACERIMHIDALPDAKVVQVSIGIDLNEELVTQTSLTLRRAAPDEDLALRPTRRSR